MNTLWESDLLIQLAAVFIVAIGTYKNAINSASVFRPSAESRAFFGRGFEVRYSSSEVWNCASLRQRFWAVLFFVYVASIFEEFYR